MKRSCCFSDYLLLLLLNDAFALANPRYASRTWAIGVCFVPANSASEKRVTESFMKMGLGITDADFREKCFTTVAKLVVKGYKNIHGKITGTYRKSLKECK